MNKMTKEEFYKIADEQTDRIIDSFGKEKEPRNFKHKFMRNNMTLITHYH